MTIDVEEIPVASRPPYKSSLPAITARTTEFYRKVQERTGAGFERLSAYMGKATVELIYVCFGFKFMRQEFSSERFWREFVIKNFPDPDAIKNRNYYIAIGERFHYDDSYLRFLTGAHYAVPAKEIDEKRNVGNQLDDLNKRLKAGGRPTIKCPADLVEWIKDETEVPRARGFKANSVPETPEDGPVADSQSSTEAAEPVETQPVESVAAIDLEVVEPSESSLKVDLEKPAVSATVNGDDCEEALDKVILSLSVLSRAKRALKAIVDRCPVFQLNEEKVSLLIASLRHAEEMKEMLE